jgi:hypothetical protein
MFLNFRCVAAAMVLGSLAAGTARGEKQGNLGPVDLVGSNVTVDQGAQTITFALRFSRPPNLHTYNAYVNAADEFAIDILNEPLSYPTLYGSGGEDVRILSSQYRDPTVTDNYGRLPTPEGWAAITTPRFEGSYLLDLVPEGQIGQKITITTSFAQLHETDGVFEAVLETYRYGAWGGMTYEIGTVFADPVLTSTPMTTTAVAAAPEPASLAVLGAGGVALLVRRRRRAAAGGT